MAALLVGVTVAGAGPAPAAERSAVLYATEASLDRIDVFGIGTNGRTEVTPFQRLTTIAPNPRRLLATRRALYVATANRIDVFRIDPASGALSRFRNDDDTFRVPAAIGRAGFRYLAVDPQERYLYAAATVADRIVGYPIAEDGSLGEVNACTQARFGTRYFGLAATDDTLYAAARGERRIHVFPIRGDGAFQARDLERPRDPCDETDECDEPGEVSGETCGEEDGKTCTDDEGVLRVWIRCERGKVCFSDNDDDCNEAPGVTFPDDTSHYRTGDIRTILVRDGILYFVERSAQRITGCPLDEIGINPKDAPQTDPKDCPRRRNDPAVISRTVPRTGYEQLAISADGILFASAFGRGRVEAFVLAAGGALPRQPRTSLADNPLASPVGIAVCNDTLYVAQGELDRVEAFRIGPNGFAGGSPISRTNEIRDSFPNDVAVVPLGEGTCAAGAAGAGG